MTKNRKSTLYLNIILRLALNLIILDCLINLYQSLWITSDLYCYFSETCKGAKFTGYLGLFSKLCLAYKFAAKCSASEVFKLLTTIKVSEPSGTALLYFTISQTYIDIFTSRLRLVCFCWAHIPKCTHTIVLPNSPDPSESLLDFKSSL